MIQANADRERLFSQKGRWVARHRWRLTCCHCEERSDEPIQRQVLQSSERLLLDCFAALAMTARVILAARGSRDFKHQKDTRAGQPILIFLCRAPGANVPARSTRERRDRQASPAGIERYWQPEAPSGIMLDGPDQTSARPTKESSTRWCD